ncbi:MAG TPA: hypothetical protein VGY55_21070 [Pirellulales bacterium]|jgi:hypothetical protein|nr:hypothetical protein [Pirellulales bacterium]
MDETIQEYCDSRGVRVRVDRAAGVIRGVKILGLHSRNGREYLPEALGRAAALYEGAKVNVNHPKGSALAPRDYQDRIGVVRGVEARPGEGSFGDLHFNPKHALAEQLIWDAEHAPENVGFSHNVQARTARRDDLLVVEEITRVQSVDLVADPATTRGLYEQSAGGGGQEAGSSRTSASSVEAHEAVGLKGVTLEQLKAERSDLVQAILQEYTSGAMPMARHGHEPQRGMATQGSGHGAPATVTPAGDREIDLRGLKERLEASEARNAALLLEQSIAEELAAAGVPRTLVTDLFREQLRAAAGADTRRQLMLERLQIARAAGSARPLSKDQYLTESAGPRRLPTDAKSFTNLITA